MINNNDFRDLQDELTAMSNLKDDITSRVEDMTFILENIIKKLNDGYELTTNLQMMRDTLGNVDLDESLDFINELNNNLNVLYYKYRNNQKNTQLIYNPVVNIQQEL